MQGRLLPQIAVGRPSKTAPFHIVFQVPIKAWLPAGVTLVTNEKDPGLTATFKRCLTNGCFADTDLPEAVLKKLRTQTKNGKLQFKNDAQRLVAIPVSFKGFASALTPWRKSERKPPIPNRAAARLLNLIRRRDFEFYRMATSWRSAVRLDFWITNPAR